jgi:hypothetical protein
LKSNAHIDLQRANAFDFARCRKRAFSAFQLVWGISRSGRSERSLRGTPALSTYLLFFEKEDYAQEYR